MTGTTTSFKQKTCPKCTNNHDNDGVLCSFCVEKYKQALKKVQKHPDNFMVKCLIEREGDTTLTLGNIQYTFTRNQAGDAVCEIINLGHYSQIIKSDFYEPYIPVEVVEADNIDEERDDEEQDTPGSPFWSEEETKLMEQLQSEGMKHTAIAAWLSDMRGETISRQRVTTYFNS